MNELAVTIRSLRWIRIFSAGAAIALSTFAFIYLAVYAYVVSYPAFGQGEIGTEQLENLVSFVGVWGARAFFLVTVVLGSSWVARSADEAIFWHGILIGLVAAIVNQMVIHFLYPPVELFELLAYAVFGVVGGALGGFEGKRSIAGKEALYRASRQITTAREPNEILAAIGEHIGGIETKSLVLWRAVSKPEDNLKNELEPWAFWTSLPGEKKRHQELLAETFKAPAVEELSSSLPRVVRVADLSNSGRLAWRQRGVRSAFVMPLYAPGEVWVGLLVVEFRKRRRLSRMEIREYLTIGSQAALALKNLQLVEQARQTGKQAGVLLERQRLSHEIHDTLAQGFTSILMSLTAMELSQQSSHTTSDSYHRYLEEARSTARENLMEARRLVWALRPEPLERYSLPEALETLVEEWSEQLGVETSTTVIGSQIPLRAETEISLFRIAQEALANTRKHAGASRVMLTLSYAEDSVVLDVLDDGIGLNAAEISGQDRLGFGLVAMRERAEHLGGSFSIESTAGKGTLLTVKLPISPEKESDSEYPFTQEETW